MRKREWFGKMLLKLKSASRSLLTRRNERIDPGGWLESIPAKYSVWQGTLIGIGTCPSHAVYSLWTRLGMVWTPKLNSTMKELTIWNARIFSHRKLLVALSMVVILLIQFHVHSTSGMKGYSLHPGMQIHAAKSTSSPTASTIVPSRAD